VEKVVGWEQAPQVCEVSEGLLRAVARGEVAGDSWVGVDQTSSRGRSERRDKEDGVGSHCRRRSKRGETGGAKPERK
jgi:hypothetical protein